MDKICRNEKGFTAIEGLLIVLVLAVMGFGGYYVWHSQQTTLTTAKTSTTTPKTTTKTTTETSTTNAYAGWNEFTTTDGDITLNYPSNWVTDSCTKTNACSTDTQEVDTFLAPSSNPTWQVIWVSHVTSNLTPQQYFNQDSNINSGSNGTIVSSNSNTVNGYSTYYAEFSAANDYVISHNNLVVILQFVNVDGGGRNTTSYLPIFTQVVKSIKFNN